MVQKPDTQCGEEKGAYYYKDHVSLDTMYVCCKKDLRFSTAAIGNSTNHTAPAVMASLLPLLKELEMSRIKHVNLISDSPNSQYCNKGMFWFLKTLCEEFNITVKWVYLESSYVKGIPDGIGAKVKKKTMENLMLSKQSVPM